MRALTAAQWRALEEMSESEWPIELSLSIDEVAGLRVADLVTWDLYGRTSVGVITEAGRAALHERGSR